MFNTLIKKLTGQKNISTQIKHRRRFRPGLEGLETRLSLSGIGTTTGTVTNGGSSVPPTSTQVSHT